MPTRLALGLLTPLLLAAILGTAPQASAAAPECKAADEQTGICLVEIQVPGSPPVKNVSGPGSSSGASPRECADFNGPVPCSDDLYGSWYGASECYLRRLEPPPAKSDPIWEGRAEGVIYRCTSAALSGPFSKVYNLWLPGPPDAVAISPEQAAQAVVARMDLRAADIGIVPEDEPGRIGAVGAPVYMWTTPGPTTFGPQVLTGSAGGVTITATAKVDRIVWSMGDGTSVTCRTPGTVYQDRYGFNMSPDCGHRYQRTSAGKPANAYPITATSYWLVNWTGPGGSSGQIPLTLSSSTAIVVGELQALVTS
jgi:hypothetical protein